MCIIELTANSLAPAQVGNRTTSAPNSVLRYDVDKDLNFVLEFNFHLPLTSQIKVRKKS